MLSQTISIPDTPNVSLVAFYGTKPTALKLFIESLQTRISEALDNSFECYLLEQVHTTIIGCEGLKTEKGILSKWFLEHRGEERYIKLADFINYVRQSDRLPIHVKIGGYAPKIDYGFLSQNKHPFERSFQFLGNIAVSIGWSLRERKISRDLDRFRLECQNFNLLHKYHKHPNSVDNDCYMRIGVIKGKVNDREIKKIEREIQNSLRNISPIHLSIGFDNLKFVRYQDLALSLDKTQIISLKNATEDKVEKFYPSR
ncbi:MAG: hypothetical protein IGR93_00695 [Hydrococcus sp. C42_A2020_068]|nr:hypothetical protein [Hydrococcus sp. C42_A2020_068]